MTAITINQWAFVSALAILWCMFCVLIVASESIEFKRFTRWGN